MSAARSGAAPRGLPGERVLAQAAARRLRGGGGGSVRGTLFCTNLRVAFVPGAQAPGAQPLVPSDSDVALRCIRKLVAACSFAKPKVLTAASSLKFIPEELAVHCRDFRLLRFRFHESGLQPQAFRVAMAIAQAREAAAWPGHADTVLQEEEEEEDGAEEDEEEDEDKEEEEEEGPTPLFESLHDWEQELKRQGAAGWRVSAVNERFDMATSLPRYLWVPGRLLDKDLKRAFAHFEERRVPRLCWHHPGGSDLLRSAGFHAASEPPREDVRCLEALLRGGHGHCVLVAPGELPSLAELRLSYAKLRALCLPDSPVADDKWLSALEGTRWLEHVRACVRKASEVASLLATRPCSVVLQEPHDRDFNCLLASLAQLLADPHARTLPGFQSLVQREWVAAGHPFARRLGLGRPSPRDEAPVFLLFLDCTWQLVRQFPGCFGFTESYLLALHDSSFVPYLSTFLFNCQWQRGRSSRLPGSVQSYTPVSGWREPPAAGGAQPGGSPPAGRRRPLSVWDWRLRYSRQQRRRFRNPAGPRAAPAAPGPHGPRPLGAAAEAPGAVWLLAKGSLWPQPRPFPWRGSPPAPRRHRSPGGTTGDPGAATAAAAAPPAPLLPCAAGPAIRLWHRCYLRARPDGTRGRLAPSAAGLAEELRLLQERLRALRPGGCPR